MEANHLKNMDKYLVCIREYPETKNLLEIIYKPFISDPYMKNQKYTIIAKFDDKQEAFLKVKELVENYIFENPDYNFTKFKEWCLE